MLIKTYKITFLNELLSLYDEMESERFFYLVLEHFHSIKRIDLALNPNFEFSEDAILRWNNVLNQLKLEIPIQYILGKTNFYGLDFEVNPNVLIPRPETEELVDWIISNNLDLKNKDFSILDIGTGSGCIAVSLAKNLKNATVFALDISEKALATAKKNAENNEVSVTFIEKDILNTLDFDTQLDIIVSNPPYVRHLEKAEIKNNVLENEPHLALFVSDTDALLFYRKIAHFALKNLKETGFLYFEINQYLGNETINLLKEIGFKDLELRKDIYGNDRMICGRI
jgi:release factor glutamine methyltransferase